MTLLELELQAEVDKYVLGAWLLREQGAAGFRASCIARCSSARAWIPCAAGGPRGPVSHRVELCRDASAGAWPRGWTRGARGATRELLAELRRFYRLGNARKLRHIERFA